MPPNGVYAVLVHGFKTDNVAGGPGAEYDLLAWEIGLSDDLGNMTATGPPVVAAGSSDDVTIDWTNLAANSIYLGAVSHSTPEGLVAFTIVRIRN